MSAKSVFFKAFCALTLTILFYCLTFAIVGILIYVAFLELVNPIWLRFAISVFCVVFGGLLLWSVLPPVKRFIIPGYRLDKKKHPKLVKEIESVAKAAGKKIPDEIYLVFDVGISLYQRRNSTGIGSKWVMTLGLPILQILSVSEFRAVIAHHFGHFYRGETVLGPWVYKTQSAIERIMEAYGENKPIVRLPYRIYGTLFLFFARKVSKAQEYAADRFAMKFAGSKNLAEALSICRNSAIVFEAYWKDEIKPLIKMGFRPPISEGYKSYYNSPFTDIAIYDADDDSIDTDTIPCERHVSIKDRIEAIEFTSDEQDENSGSAISLIEEVYGIEKELLSMMGSREKVEALKPIRWEEIGPAIYLPMWETIVSLNIKVLKIITPAVLPGVAANPANLIKRLSEYHQKSYQRDKETKPICSSVNAAHCTIMSYGMDELCLACSTIGAALSVALYKRGWKIYALPGVEVYMKKEEQMVEPFNVLRLLASGELDGQKWRDQCKQLGIYDVELSSSEGFLIN
ncbi:MAG: M48 family metallopeptidase [Clostridia bacterium]|nr:M48 family metallopeptidase [Clostridia bacterium]